MVDLNLGNTLSTIKEKSITFGTSSFKFITIIIIAMIILIFVAVVVFLVFSYLKYNKKILLWDRYKLRKFMAMEVKYNKLGDVVFKVKKNGKILPRPSITIAPNTYLYSLRDDGEWINVGLEDINYKTRQASVKLIDPDMRYARSSLHELMKARYDKKDFWTTLAPIVIPIIALAVVCLLVYFIADKLLEIGTQLTNALGAQSAVIDKLNTVITSIDNICSQSGIKK